MQTADYRKISFDGVLQSLNKRVLICVQKPSEKNQIAKSVKLRLAKINETLVQNRVSMDPSLPKRVHPSWTVW